MRKSSHSGAFRFYFKPIFVRLKKLFTILLLSILSFHQTELHQVLKFPVLVEHYFEHREENKELTLLEFLKLHYLDDKVKSDYQRDMQLPFKADHCILTASPLVVPEGISWEKPEPAIIDFNFPKIEQNRKASGYLEDIFRPPKTA